MWRSIQGRLLLVLLTVLHLAAAWDTRDAAATRAAPQHWYTRSRQQQRQHGRDLHTDPTHPSPGNSMQPSTVAASITNINSFIDAAKSCPEGCELLGNCNKESGQCECPWGRTGPICEVDQLSLCYPSTNHTFPSCGTYVPKSCECYRQCFDVYCFPTAEHPHYLDHCTHELAQKIGEGRCFLHPDRPASEQESVIYAANSTEGQQLQWFRMPHQSPKEWPGGRPPETLDNKMKYVCWNGWSSWDFVTYAVPLEQCPQGCNSRGTCVKNPERVYCLCRKGFKGNACEENDAEGACWFAPTCNGHGVCRSGFCHCEEGWWGLGCTRSSAFALTPGSRAVQSRTRLKIYMYDLPAKVVFAGEFDDGAYTRDQMYAAYEYFLTYFLSDWTVRTENPHEANMFYIPALVFFYAGNVRNPAPHLHNVVRYISTEFPFWNRTHGKDHFWFLTGDQGACGLFERDQDNNARLIDWPIKLVHFGLSGQGVEWRYPVDKDYACLRPERDIVVPPVADYAYAKEGKTAELYKHVLEHGGDDGQNRTMLFFFAGGVNMQDKFVSGYARQALMLFLKDKNFSDVLVKEGRVDNYEKMFLTSKFCIAPYGFGWGLRLPIAVVHGCIPVIIQDHVWQPFEELLPYRDFSVRLQVKDVPKVMEILRAYTDEEIKAMRLVLAKHWPAFLWPQAGGGHAYNYTINALRHRMHNHAAEYYRRQA